MVLLLQIARSRFQRSRSILSSLTRLDSRNGVQVARSLGVVSHRGLCSLKETLDKMKVEENKKEGGNLHKDDTDSATQTSDSINRPQEAAENSQSQTSASKSAPTPSVFQSAGALISGIFTSMKDAHEELFGGRKESMLIRKVAQAESYKRARKPKEGEEEEEDDDLKYDGPSELVTVKSKKSPWEAMRERLQDSPIIREVLRNTKKVTAAAADTTIGKQAVKLGQTVNEKIEVLLFLVTNTR
jgi:hypothetical protein